MSVPASRRSIYVYNTIHSKRRLLVYVRFVYASIFVYFHRFTGMRDTLFGVRATPSRIPVLPDGGRTRRESLSGVLHHVHLQVRPVGRSVRAERALVHGLFTAFVNHVSPEVLHLVVTTIAVVAGETALAARSPSILSHAAHVVPHFRVICNHVERVLG